MVGVLIVGFVANLGIRAVDDRYLEEPAVDTALVDETADTADREFDLRGSTAREGARR